MTLERWCHDVELLVTHLQGKGNDKAEKQARWCNGNEMKTKAKRVGDNWTLSICRYILVHYLSVPPKVMLNDKKPTLSGRLPKTSAEVGRNDRRQKTQTE